jgi:hypothetical protein
MKKHENESVVSIVDPMMMVQVTDNPTLQNVADEAQAKLKRVIDNLSNQ